VFVFQEDAEWLSEISAEIDKHTSESSILLPKTPAAKRKLRKRCLVETIPEDSTSGLKFRMYLVVPWSTAAFVGALSHTKPPSAGNLESVQFDVPYSTELRSAEL
jgi:hypothetical protein